MKHEPRAFGQRRRIDRQREQQQRQARRAAVISIAWAGLFAIGGAACAYTDEPGGALVAVLGFFSALVIATLAAMDA